MGLQLQEFVDKCVSIAQGRGLSSDYPVTLKVKENASGTETLIVVSYTEPSDSILPLNVTWIMGDPSDEDFKEPLKRDSKNSSGGFDNTWLEVDTYQDIFEPPQYYAPEDNPQPVYAQDELEDLLKEYVRKEGDTVSGPLHLRSPSATDPLAQTEAVPRSYHSAQQNQQTQGFYNLILGLMRRVSSVESLSSNNKSRLDNLNLDPGAGGGTGTAGFNYTQKEPSDTWIIEHNLATDNIIAVVYDSTGEQIIPAKVETVEGSDKNSLAILFAEDISGKAVLVKV